VNCEVKDKELLEVTIFTRTTDEIAISIIEKLSGKVLESKSISYKRIDDRKDEYTPPTTLTFETVTTPGSFTITVKSSSRFNSSKVMVYCKIVENSSSGCPSPKMRNVETIDVPLTPTVSASQPLIFPKRSNELISFDESIEVIEKKSKLSNIVYLSSPSTSCSSPKSPEKPRQRFLCALALPSLKELMLTDLPQRNQKIP